MVVTAGLVVKLGVLLLLISTVFVCMAEKPIPLVAFSTHHREPQDWLALSLASLLLASQGYEQLPQVHLMVGDTDSHYLDNLKHHKNFFVHELSPKEAQWWSAVPRKRGNWKGGFNYVRCLNLTLPQHSPLHIAEFDGVLIAEDDVVFTNDFWVRFQEVRSAVEEDFPGRDYIIDCYHRFSNGGKPSAPGKPYRLYKNHFCCTQLMFFTNGAARRVGHYLQTELDKTDRLGYDISIFKASQLYNIPFVGALPALGQHVGVKSSIGSMGFHISDRAHFESKDTPGIHYQRTNKALHYGPKLTQSLLMERPHLTQQLERHANLMRELRRAGRHTESTGGGSTL